MLFPNFSLLLLLSANRVMSFFLFFSFFFLLFMIIGLFTSTQLTQKVHATLQISCILVQGYVTFWQLHVNVAINYFFDPKTNHPFPTATRRWYNVERCCGWIIPHWSSNMRKVFLYLTIFFEVINFISFFFLYEKKNLMQKVNAHSNIFHEFIIHFLLMEIYKATNLQRNAKIMTSLQNFFKL